MLLHTLKHVLPLLEEKDGELLKQASLEKDFPVSTKEDILASATAITYIEKIAGQSVAPQYRDLVHRAVKVASLEKEAQDLSSKLIRNHLEQAMEKAASTLSDAGTLRIQMQDAITGISPDFEKAASYAEALDDMGGVSTFEESCYAGRIPLDKEAAVSSLAARAKLSSLENANGFLKLAKLVYQLDTETAPMEVISTICKEAAALDKKACLHTRGFNPYRDFFVKQAGLTIGIAGTQVPYEKVAKLGKANIAKALGIDVAESLFNSPAEDKQILETLPLDLQQLLLSLVKRV